MFKSLFEFVNEGKRGADIDKLIENVDKFAFGKKLRELLPADATDEQTVAAIIKEGLAYGSKPKGLILFHSYGDEALGKKIGGDILEGKQTYLMVQAMSRATEEEREVLRTTHRRGDISDSEKIATVKALYDKLDVKRLTEQQIELRFERALAILDSLTIGAERTHHLRDFARNLMGRKK